MCACVYVCVFLSIELASIYQLPRRFSNHARNDSLVAGDSIGGGKRYYQSVAVYFQTNRSVKALHGSNKFFFFFLLTHQPCSRPREIEFLEIHRERHHTNKHTPTLRNSLYWFTKRDPGQRDSLSSSPLVTIVQVANVRR